MTWPPPEVPARPADPTQVPRGATLVARRAQAAGWAVAATYARGTVPGRPPHVVDSLALRMRRGRQRAVAVWHDQRFHFAFTWSADDSIRVLNVTTLRKELAA